MFGGLARSRPRCLGLARLGVAPDGARRRFWGLAGRLGVFPRVACVRAVCGLPVPACGSVGIEGQIGIKKPLQASTKSCRMTQHPKERNGDEEVH